MQSPSVTHVRIGVSCCLVPETAFKTRRRVWLPYVAHTVTPWRPPIMSAALPMV